MTSASPWRIDFAASPMQCVDVVQAVTIARFGPLVPSMIERFPAIMLTMVPGMKNGEMRRGPLFSSSLCISSISGRPPMPEPKLMPKRSAVSGATALPESFQACNPAAMPKWMNLSMRRASFADRYCETSKSFTSPAIWQERREGSKRVTRVMPDFPASTLRHASATLLPTGLMTPSPVTTTLRRCTVVSDQALECDLT